MMENITSPFKEALQAIIPGKNFSVDLNGISHSSQLSDEQFEELQNWCSYHANPSWATGLSMIDAADLIVKSAEEKLIERKQEKEF